MRPGRFIRTVYWKPVREFDLAGGQTIPGHENNGSLEILYG